MNQVTMFDTPIYKLSRTNSPETSKAAARKVNTRDKKLLVLNAVIAAGEYGATTREILERHPEIAYSSVTARPADLARSGLIYYRGDKRKKCRVMRSTS
jgi:sulfur transfer complex TusBCD TusB component (DsrH family)